jgi:folate-binding protein YgfZ
MPSFDLSARLKLRLTGSDRVRFLNGQVTNDVRKANANLSMAACVLSAKGKMDALIFISAADEALLIDTDPELKETLAARLDRYLIADDVAIEDVTKDFSLFHVSGETAPALPNDVHWRRGKRFGTAGWDLFGPATAHEHTRQLLAAREPLGTPDEAERWRIEQGVPRWSRELTAQIIPVEAGLEGDAIDYAKGCYVGQEVISRMKMSGQTNKRLCGLVSIDGTPLAPELRLFTTSAVAGVADPGREMGWITSATRSDRLGKEIALGYVKRGANCVGTRLAARAANGVAIAVEVVELPFR